MASLAHDFPLGRRRGAARLPGVLLSLCIAALAMLLARLEHRLVGRAWLEPLVLAILLGTTVRSAWAPGSGWQPGLRFSGKTLLEVAIVLLGLTVSAATLFAAGPLLLAGIAGVVAAALVCGTLAGRLLGLPVRMALLVACGNAICGNSAIAAVAPVIGADGEDVAAAIAFTAVLGVGVVVALPIAALAAGMAPLPFGALAGLTVYAVPQVIAAAAPLGPAAVQMGTLVKLVRVLMLGPVCLVLSLVAPRLGGGGTRPAGPRPPVARLVPWFIIGFLLLAGIRSAGIVPAVLAEAAGRMAGLLTVISMAALGLGCDVRTVVRAGGRVTAAVLLSLGMLGGLSLLLVRAAGLA